MSEIPIRLTDPKDPGGHYGDHAMWFPVTYKGLVEDEALTAAVRPGDRSDPNSKTGLPVGEPIPIRFITEKGAPSRNISSILAPFQPEIWVRVTGVVVKHIEELTEGDLTGFSPDAAMPELVRWHIGVTYNRPLPDMGDLVTIWRWEYCDPPEWWTEVEYL